MYSDLLECVVASDSGGSFVPILIMILYLK